MNPSNPHIPIRPGPAHQRACLDLVRSLLGSGEEGKTRDLALRCWNSHPGDPEILRGWGEVCEQLAMARQARQCYG